MNKFFKIAGFGMCLMLIGTFAVAGNGKGRGYGAVQAYNQTVRNQNCETRQSIVRANHRQPETNMVFNAGRQMQNTQRMTGPKGTQSRAKDGSGPINRSGVSRPNYTDANHDGICDNAAK